MIKGAEWRLGWGRGADGPPSRLDPLMMQQMVFFLPRFFSLLFFPSLTSYFNFENVAKCEGNFPLLFSQKKNSLKSAKYKY